MKSRMILVAASLISLAFAGNISAHELIDSNGRPITTHQHVWRAQSYGQDYRQGHSVNNALGSITIWSPSTYNGYKAGGNVRFARPSLQLSKPKPGSNIPLIQNQSRSTTTRGNK